MPIAGGSNELYFATGIDNSGLMRGQKQTLGLIRGMASQISKEDVFAGLAIAAAAAFGKISKEMKQFSEEYEHTMKEVQTISQAVQDDFEGYSQSLIDLSKEVPQSANELGKAYYQIVSAGYDGAEGLNLLGISARGAVGGVTDVKTAADGLTTVMNAWKLSAADASMVSDTFFNTVEKGKTTFGELAANIAQVAPLAAAYGVSFEQIASATATITKQGTTTAQAMTQLRQGLIAVNEELGKGWSETYTLQEAFGELARRAEESGKDIKEFTGRVEGAMAILATTGINAAGAAEDLKSYGEAAGAAGDAFGVMVEDSVNQSLILKNNLKAALKPLGDFWAGKSTEFAKALNEAFASGDIEKFAKYVAIATASLVAYSVATKAATISKMQFLRAIVKTKNAMQAFNLVAKANPIGLLVSALTAAATAFLLFRQRAIESSSGVKEFFSDMNKEITLLDAYFNVAEKAAEGTDARKKAIEGINSKYGDYLDNLLSEKSTLEDIKTAQDQAKEAAISRIAETAKAAAMEEALTDAMEKQGELQTRLYKYLSKSVGEEAAGLAVQNLRSLSEEFHNLRSAYESAQAAGKGGLGFSRQADTLIQDFVDKFNNGEDYNLIWNLANQIHIDQTNLDAKKEELETFYAGFIQDIQEGIDEEIEGGEGKKGKGGLKLLDVDGLDAQLRAAKQAFQEIEEFIKAGLPIPDYLKKWSDIARTWGGYLDKMSVDYEGYKDKLDIINLEIARNSLEIHKENLIKIEEFTEEAEKLTDGLTEGSTASFKAMVKAIVAGAKEIEKVYKELIIIGGEAFTPEQFEKFLEGLDKVAIVASEVGRIFKDLDRTIGGDGYGTLTELGEIFELVGEQVEAAGKALEGDYFGAILQYATSLSSFFIGLIQRVKEMEAIELEKYADKIEHAVSVITRQLSEQADILHELEGLDFLSGAPSTLAEFEAGITRVLGLMEQLKIQLERPPSTWWERLWNKPSLVDVDTTGWTPEQYQDLLDREGTNISKATRAQIEKYLADLRWMEGEIIDINNRIQSETIGFSLDYLVDSVMSMFDDIKDGAADFSQTFEDIIEQSLKNAFRQQLIAKYLQPFYDELFKAMESRGSGDRSTPPREDAFGNLTEGEINTLMESWNKISESMGAEIEGWLAFLDQVGLDLGGAEEDPNSLSGAIRRGLTEETGSLLAGKMNIMMLTQQEMLGLQTDMVDHLAAIEQNTEYNHYLHRLDGIADDIAQIKIDLTA